MISLDIGSMSNAFKNEGGKICWIIQKCDMMIKFVTNIIDYIGNTDEKVFRKEIEMRVGVTILFVFSI